MPADALGHKHIGPEHLLLGLLREDKSVAASVLMAHGVTLKDARQIAAERTQHSPDRIDHADDLDAALGQIRRIEEMLAKIAPLVEDAKVDEVLMAMRTELDTLRQRLSRYRG